VKAEKGIDLRIIGYTDTGLIRKTNQDDFAYGKLNEKASYAVVCDGMGGANGGNVASSTAVKVISESITKGFKDELDNEQIKGLLCNSVQFANSYVYKLSISDLTLNGMGTTVVACIVNNIAESGIAGNSIAYIAHAGDSRAYFINSKGITQITRDHSIVQSLVENGKLTPDEAKEHPKKNIITRALGVEKSLDIDLYETTLADNDIIIICTDGLTNHVDTDTIYSIVQQYGFDECGKQLIKVANQNGGSDNITIVVISK
jgi:serine/threonine protein phosphatase PrpC